MGRGDSYFNPRGAKPCSASTDTNGGPRIFFPSQNTPIFDDLEPH